MPLQLPTDTQHIRLETRQYELFNRPLGQGISRRKMAVGVVSALAWWSILLLCGLNPLWRFGPMVYIVPVFLVVWRGTQKDESGRMELLKWYDWLLSRMPSRRAVITNPLIAVGDYQPVVIYLEATAELHPRMPGASLSPLRGRRRRRKKAAS